MDELARPTISDQHFGLGLLDNMMEPWRSSYAGFPTVLQSYWRPWRLIAAPQSGVSHIQDDKDGFKINLDVQQFKPDEVSVKVIDWFIVVTGKHEERSDEHGFISREVTRRYYIPETVETKSLTSSLSSDGVLSISAPKKVSFCSLYIERLFSLTVKCDEFN